MASTVILNPPPKITLKYLYITKILVWPNKMEKEFIIAEKLNHNYDKNINNEFRE